MCHPRSIHRFAFFPVAFFLTAAEGCTAGGGTIVEPPAVRSVTVAPSTVVIAVGGQPQPLIASTDVAGGAAKTVTWTSSDPTVAQVVASGQSATVAAIRPGVAYVIATATADASKRDSSRVTVTAGTIASISISAPATSIIAFSTLQVVAVAKDASGNTVSGATPTWTSSDPAIAAVAATGLVTGKSPGTVNITASLGTVTSNAISLTVTNPAVANITVTAASSTVIAFGTLQVQATVKDANGNSLAGVPLTWASSAPAVATVSGTGLVTGKRPGGFSVTASFGDAVSNALALSVVNPSIASITLSAGTTTLVTSTTLQVQAVVRDGAGNILNGVDLAWDATPAVVATVSNTGLVTGNVAGQVNITAAAGSITSNVLTLTVVSGPVATITVTPASPTVAVGSTQQFSAVGRDGGGNIVGITPVWTVTPGGGTINASTGLFTANGTAGSYTVTASSGGRTGTATVTVTAGPFASILVTPNSASLQLGTTQQFTATGKDAGGNTVAIPPPAVVWSVNMGGVGTINSSGLYSAGSGAGSAIITAAGGGKLGTASVTVTTPGPLATITVAPASASLPPNGTQTFTASGKDSFSNNVSITPVWSVTAGGGSITSAGVLTVGTVSGTYTVTATSGTVSGTANVTVNPGPLATITVTPANAPSVPRSGTQQFAAAGKDSFGNTVTLAPPVWTISAGLGTINASTGLFTAPAVASAMQTVTATSGGKMGTATVTVP